MFKKACLLSAAALCLSAACFSLRVAGAPKPPPELPTMAQFDNSPGYKITSDEVSTGLPFIDGVGGVEAVINVNSGDFLFNLYRARRPIRHLTFALGAGPDLSLGSGCPSPVNPNAPNSGEQNYMAFLNVQNVWFVPDDLNWHETGALFLTFEPAGNFRFSPEYNLNQGNCGTTKVKVRRARELQPQNGGRPVWEIWAVPSENDIALQVQEINRQTQPVGYFHLPFKLTVKLL